jgi:hypothetical protein
MDVLITHKADIVVVNVDIVISASLPVDDFDVNHVMWDCIANTVDTQGLCDVNELVAKIKKKEATMLQGYLALQDEYLKGNTNDRVLTFGEHVDAMMTIGYTISNYKPRPKCHGVKPTLPEAIGIASGSIATTAEPLKSALIVMIEALVV